jgi:hypothetical protein
MSVTGQKRRVACHRLICRRLTVIVGANVISPDAVAIEMLRKVVAFVKKGDEAPRVLN